MANCDCSDRGCTQHRGFAFCITSASEIVYRVDMEDLDGTLMCAACAADAYETGLFTSEAPTLERDSGEAWTEFYATHPDYDMDHDHSMDY